MLAEEKGSQVSRFQAVTKLKVEPEQRTINVPAGQRRYEKARRGSAGWTKVEKAESALADGTSFVTASVFEK